MWSSQLLSSTKIKSDYPLEPKTCSTPKFIHVKNDHYILATAITSPHLSKHVEDKIFSQRSVSTHSHKIIREKLQQQRRQRTRINTSTGINRFTYNSKMTEITRQKKRKHFGWLYSKTKLFSLSKLLSKRRKTVYHV
ncbi:unnamed protein product [Didymodactylos carnosus]|uniref:Uncharacterized protein n=1 Tax=Didymodactylos carnosus TaxID=1234261 RepID=A0A814N0F5_9BILA|nr:unnamed protein product [Didymodactylos carnosus]CAF1503885.1 unnamed protein product [Didymodactylos carnosus]CAF3852064.1 unnamed protein product [Didymodactylos carnosus]CAF4292269.1 unnamed protein product [Didymodactylos carnosus]